MIKDRKQNWRQMFYKQGLNMAVAISLGVALGSTGNYILNKDKTNSPILARDMMCQVFVGGANGTISKKLIFKRVTPREAYMLAAMASGRIGARRSPRLRGGLLPAGFRCGAKNQGFMGFVSLGLFPEEAKINGNS